MRIGFYAAVPRRRLLQVVEFYRQDIIALQRLGHDVGVASSPAQLRAADAYWAWWQTSGAPAVLAARLRRRPCVLVTALSDSDTTPSGLTSKSPVARLASKLALRSADLVLATSQSTLEGLGHYRTRAIRVAPLGVDIERYQPNPYLTRGPPSIVTISQLTPDNVVRKRVVDVVHTAALVPDVRFIIVGRFAGGEAPVQDAIRRLRLQDRVVLAGEVSAEEKRRLLARCTVYLQPTLYEAFGLAIGEAMASGAVVVSNRVGNVPEVVGDAGYLLPAGASPEAFAEAITAAMTEPLAGVLRRRARKRIEQYFSFEQRVHHVAAALTTVTVRGS